MIPIEEYILLPLEQRQAHLRLNEPCLERGGHPKMISVYVRGLLAHVLDTSIPTGKWILACHACNNGLCSHPNHLYWGTPRENSWDARRAGTVRTPWENAVAKHGLEEARRRQFRGRGGMADTSVLKADATP